MRMMSFLLRSRPLLHAFLAKSRMIGPLRPPYQPRKGPVVMEPFPLPKKHGDHMTDSEGSVMLLSIVESQYGRETVGSTRRNSSSTLQYEHVG
ncbi:hypothetical protein DPMN_173041 [Dreissena polymorpha]|uniref:Uncharacterized protein n=1 Tax=Dreissena polymorpha TaxID=45954 RepID=A0A9D4E247_DREPO|nr:hypothetical protein DPMN_173041 [Dreissena polymorpha]